MSVPRDTPRPGQTSVWDFPRPAVAQASARHLKIVHRGIVVAETQAAVMTLETSHPPTYYFPPADVLFDLLPNPKASFCEWKGHARYHDVVAGGERLQGAAWSYFDPTDSFAALRDHVAFYAARFDACTVDDAVVVPQPGGFYGGWITPDLAGPFKGVEGSRFW